MAIRGVEAIFLAAVLSVTVGATKSYKKIIDGSYVIDLPNYCNTQCVRRIFYGVEDAGCERAGLRRLANFAKNDHGDTFLRMRCLSYKHQITPEDLEHSLIEAGVAVRSVEHDHIARKVDYTLTWNVDEVDSDPFDDKRCRAGSKLGSGTTVLILDSGCTPHGVTYCYNYIGDYSREHCADSDGHGTAVAGVVGHKSMGVAPNVAIGCSRVLGKDGSGAYSGVIEAVFHAAEFAKEQERPVIVNMAFGGPKSYILNRAVQDASKHAVFIVAAGNEDEDVRLTSPASVADNKRIFTVGAHGFDGKKAWFSNFGANVKITAPGVDIPAPTLAKTIDFFSGTSFAAAHVSAAAAVLISDGKPVNLETLCTSSEYYYNPQHKKVSKLSYWC